MCWGKNTNERTKSENTFWSFEDKRIIKRLKRGRLIDMIAQQGFETQRGREFSEAPDWAANHSQPRNDSRTAESLLLWKRHHHGHCFNPWKPVKLTWGSGSYLMLLYSQNNAVPAARHRQDLFTNVLLLEVTIISSPREWLGWGWWGVVSVKSSWYGLQNT